MWGNAGDKRKTVTRMNAHKCTLHCIEVQNFEFENPGKSLNLDSTLSLQPNNLHSSIFVEIR